MSRISTLSNSRKLRITYTRNLARCTNRARADSDLDNISTRENQRFSHLSRSNIASDNDR